MDTFQFKLRLDLAARLVERRIVTKRGCWELPETGHMYSRIWLDGEYKYAHRLIFWVLDGVWIEKGGIVCHKCDNSMCFNPNHLHLGDQSLNMQERAYRGRTKTVKLSPQDVQQIRMFLGKGLPTKAIANMFEVNKRTIQRIKNRTHWKYVS